MGLVEIDFFGIICRELGGFPSLEYVPEGISPPFPSLMNIIS
jgi:hypothetical protein